MCISILVLCRRLFAYPAGSGVKGTLGCDGEFSGNSIRGKSSVQEWESHLDKTNDKMNSK